MLVQIIYLVFKQKIIEIYRYILIFLKVLEVGIINHRHIFLFQDGMNLVIMKEEIFLVYIVLLLA